MGMQASGLIVGGKVVPVVDAKGASIPVYNWHDHGMQFGVGDGGRKRREKIDLSVWHWTGGEGDVRLLYRVLETRELGVETFIDADGVIYQFADPLEVDTFDAGPYNPRSWGTEITNYGFTGPGRSSPNMKRPTYRMRMHGRDHTFASFFPAQIASALALANAQSKALPIARAVPTGADGKLFAAEIPRPWLRAFSGHVGHFQLTAGKCDPGNDLLSAYLADGFLRAKVA